MAACTVFFVGKPGAGKGTQADLLSRASGWPVVSTSGGLRALVAEGGAAGRKLEETMDAGLLTPYWLATYVYLKSLLSVPEDGGVIFDGTVRTLPEAKAVRDSVTWLERPFHIFNLKVSDDEARARIELRREKEGRKDDAAIERRLEEYYANTEQAIAFYRSAKILVELDGERTPEAIASDVRRMLGLV